MKVLIADDDRIVRFSLRSMLDEVSEFPLNINEVSNGQQLIDYCKNNSPDIVFVDINMPIIDGISAIEECQKYSPSSKYIILTAYAEFDYAKRCISLNVSDYILKPVFTEELTAILKKVVKEISQEKQKILLDFQTEIRSLFESWNKLGVSEFYSESRFFYSLVNIFIDTASDEKRQTAIKSVAQFIGNLDEEFFKRKCYIATVSSDRQLVQIIMRSDKKENRNSFIYNLNSFCIEHSKNNLLITGVALAKYKLEDLYSESQLVLKNRFIRFLGEKGRTTFADSFDEIAQTGAFNFSAQISNLLTDFGNADEIKFVSNISKLLEVFPSPPEGIKIKNVAGYMSVIVGHDLRADNYREFISSLSGLQKFMKPDLTLPTSDKISLIQDYIAKNYMNDISVASISAQFTLSPNYLSMLFRKTTGVKFVDYLTEVRISNAKKIISNSPNISIKNVADMVGYTSSRHFTTRFKNSVGMYPSDYRKKKSEEV